MNSAKNRGGSEKKRRGAPPQFLFKPGQSGNPGGRPKGSGDQRRGTKVLWQALGEVAKDAKGQPILGEDGKPITKLRDVIDALVAKARAQDVFAAREILDRIDGRARVADEDRPPPTQINIMVALKTVSTPALKELRAALIQAEAKEVQ